MARRLITTTGNEVFTAKVYRDSDWNEYRVRFFHFEDLMKDADYHTDDKEDAMLTALHAVGEMTANWKARFA